MSEPGAYVDTESDQVRQIRINNQHQVEREIHEERSFVGLSFRDRLDQARGYLFGKFENVKGDNPVNFRKVGAGKLVWDPARLVLLPRYLDFVDPPEIDWFIESTNSLCEKVSGIIKSEKAKGVDVTQMGERLSAVAFSLGTLIHPYIDGNGQTLKTVSLSYLDEFGKGKYGDAHFPDRLSKLKSSTTVGMSAGSQLVNKSDSPLRSGQEITDDPDIRALLFVQDDPSPTEPKLNVPQDQYDEYLKDRQSWARKRLAGLGVSILDNEDPSDKLSKVFDELKTRIGNKGLSNEMLGWKKMSPIDRFVLYLTTTTRGASWVENYVRTGKPLEKVDTFRDLRWVEPLAYEMFQQVERDISRLLIG